MRTSGAELERLRLRDAAEVWRVLEPAGALGIAGSATGLIAVATILASNRLSPVDTGPSRP